MADDSRPESAAVRVTRAYEAPGPEDGHRVLVDRLWPRGVAKSAARIDEWATEITPSNELRRWFHEDPPGRREEFVDRYRAELAAPTARETLDRLRGLTRTAPPVTLVTAAKDPEDSHVRVLRDSLLE